MPCSVVASSQQENFDCAAGSESDTTEPGGNNTAVVGHEQIARN